MSSGRGHKVGPVCGEALVSAEVLPLALHRQSCAGGEKEVQDSTSLEASSTVTV